MPEPNSKKLLCTVGTKLECLHVCSVEKGQGYVYLNINEKFLLLIFNDALFLI